ncbi:NADH(P)-binding-domain-containing protein [Thelonectria olida]|uniref:NADH(P)-binding-domain-containing protein n=1 Tax=Thelonectria olida TaxID=1576542 RepID=A0A9P8VVU9_9HYPO|nr:NADH(P)-binding-domain-containing protein [Thelonectria olida]
MHLLILGATGKTGNFSYKYALEQGHHVTILARATSSINPHESLTVVKGSALSEEDMRRAFSASGIPVDSVLQWLNPARDNDWNPWAKFRGPTRLLADATAIAARALREQQPQPTEHKPRLIAMNALGAGESRKVSPLITKFIIDDTNIGKTYEDHNAVDAEIEGNCGEDVLWTVALAAALSQEGRKPVRTFAPTQTGASFSITRESCARWMVDVAGGKMGDEFTHPLKLNLKGRRPFGDTAASPLWHIPSLVR